MLSPPDTNVILLNQGDHTSLQNTLKIVQNSNLGIALVLIAHTEVSTHLLRLFGTPR